MKLAPALLVLAFLAVVTGVLLLSIPAGLIVAGVLLAGAGVAQLERPTLPAAEPRPGRRGGTQ
ncbi:hypothetical protein P5P86_11800 [Nocardioides sp. BP30]|uniref:hypothetical protein n=1 Tax=Nocardioides sp. BP30 TaxID=3036374 RepID=UPI0024683E46|nr:hypothetical protein [Nocardioides sp. BP30]WGL50648.1 hypothetical protein P5P86_11800 [Nocardioides sp. BP30]